MADRSDPLPLGMALGLLGLGVAAVTFGTLGADNVTYARTVWTARLALLLAAPAIVLYVANAPRGTWWRAFWSAGAAAYLLHFWWAIFRAYGGDFSAVVARQDWVAYSNLVATALWLASAIAAWVWPAASGWLLRILHFLAWAIVTISFLAATAFFRSGESALFGYFLLALIVGTLVVRRIDWRRAA
ncbi:MAG: hypothetical protein JOY81_11875 [Alphaproteobacteria bacterium]|nr:hypothetical protein [Alphaproteobacteria bacterium]